MSYSLQLHRLQHARTALSPRVCSNSCPLSQWCYLTISSSAVPFTFHLPSFPASESFPMSWLVSSGSQRIGASASASVLPMNIQGWFSLGLTGLISLLSKGLSRVFSNMAVWKHQFFSAQLSLWSNSYPYMTVGKTLALARWTFVSKVMSLFFNMMSRSVIAFFPRSKHLLTSCQQSPSAVIWEPPKIKVSHGVHCFPIYLPGSDGTGCHDLHFLNVEF